MMRLEPGALVDQYRIVTEVGRGGMGVVYRARQERLDRDVAIKMLPASLAEDHNLRTRLLREARAVASLRHPAILVIHDVGDYEGTPYLVTEFIDGGTAARYCGRAQPLSIVVQLLGPIADALDYAHGRGIVHRDVKPANILLRRNGSPVLADFGLALEPGVDARLTRTGLVLGTPAYMAPEQALQTAEALSPAVDRYTLAVIAYELITGQVPFTDSQPLAVAMAHVGKAPPQPRSYSQPIPPAAVSALLRGLAKEPRDRFPSATAFIHALRDGGLETSSTPNALSSSLPAASTGALVSAQAVTLVDPPESRISLNEGQPDQRRLARTLTGRPRSLLLAAVGLAAAFAIVGTVFVVRAGGPGAAIPASVTATPSRARVARGNAPVRAWPTATNRAVVPTAGATIRPPTNTRIVVVTAIAVSRPAPRTATITATSTSTPVATSTNSPRVATSTITPRVGITPVGAMAPPPVVKPAGPLSAKQAGDHRPAPALHHGAPAKPDDGKKHARHPAGHGGRR